LHLCQPGKHLSLRVCHSPKKLLSTSTLRKTDLFLFLCLLPARCATGSNNVICRYNKCRPLLHRQIHDAHHLSMCSLFYVPSTQYLPHATASKITALVYANQDLPYDHTTYCVHDAETYSAIKRMVLFLNIFIQITYNVHIVRVSSNVQVSRRLMNAASNRTPNQLSQAQYQLDHHFSEESTSAATSAETSGEHVSVSREISVRSEQEVWDDIAS
jgi:hypothetical protein